MKKITFLIVFISIFGYAQTAIQTNIPNFEDGLLQGLEFQNSEMINENTDYSLNLYHSKLSMYRVFYGRFDTDYISSREQEFDNGIKILSKRENWDFESNSSVPYFKEEYTYNENRNIILMLKDSWNTDTQSYTSSFKEEYTYNENRNIILMLKDRWNTDTQSYTSDFKQEYTYNENGNLIQILVSSWDTESQSYSLSAKQEYTYNENDNLIQMLKSFWDTESQSFSYYNGHKQEYTYNENGRLILNTRKSNWDSQIWRNRRTTDYVWDGNGNLISFLWKFWDSESIYIPSHKGIMTYSNFSQNFILESVTRDSWNEELNIYDPTFRTIFSTTLDSEDELHRTGTISKYNIESDNWDEIDSRFLKYTKTPSLSTNSVEPNSFSIYPNPTNNTLFISGNETPIAVAIYNVLGKEVLSIKNTNNINVQPLPSGVYVIRISDGVGQTNKKFIKN